MGPGFFDKVVYGVFRAINEELGRGTWRVVWGMGEYILSEVYDDLGLGDVSDPIEGLRRIARWLIDVGYFKDLKVIRASMDRVEYWMLDPVISSSARKLIDSGMVPPHISTSIMFAYLSRMGYGASMDGGPEFRGDGYIVERWVVRRISRE